ncbi:MAG: nucleotidyltransferase domain-containing protein [Phormidesmis sp.]
MTADGTVVLNDLPFQPGDTLKIIVVKQVPDDQPFLSQDKPKNWENANPAYWIREAVERITKTFAPEKIILFGSHAKDNATSESDIDLLVIFQEVSDARAQAISIRRLLVDFPIGKDIVVASQRDIAEYGHLIGTVLHPALKEGKVIYERTYSSADA